MLFRPIPKPTPMPPSELREIISVLGCGNQEAVARLIGVSRPTVSLWLGGRVGVPLPVAMLLRLLAEERQLEAA